jgi:hypothetical protein
MASRMHGQRELWVAFTDLTLNFQGVFCLRFMHEPRIREVNVEMCVLST